MNLSERRGIDGMSIMSIKIVLGVVLVLVGMGISGYAFVDVVAGSSSMTNSTGIVVASLVGLGIYLRKLSYHE